MAIDLDALAITYALFTLLPGYLSYWQYRKRSHDVKPRAEYEVAIWSLLASAVSLGVTYVLFIVGSSLFTGEFVVLPISELTLSLIIIAYFPLLGVAIALGYVAGTWVRRRNRRKKRFTTPGVWRKMQDYIVEVTSDGETTIPVYIFTKSNQEIHGWLSNLGDSDARRDILVEAPLLVFRNDDGEITTRKDIGRFMYVHESDIAKIGFNADFLVLRPGSSDREGAKNAR